MFDRLLDEPEWFKVLFVLGWLVAMLSMISTLAFWMVGDAIQAMGLYEVDIAKTKELGWYVGALSGLALTIQIVRIAKNEAREPACRWPA